MIIVIQIVVIIVALAIVVAVLSSRQSHVARAWKKIALVLLAGTMVVAVLFPDITNKIANFVGIGRGADLLLYLTVLAFIGYVLNAYVHRQRDKDVLYRLARKVAIIDANKRYDIKEEGL